MFVVTLVSSEEDTQITSTRSSTNRPSKRRCDLFSIPAKESSLKLTSKTDIVSLSSHKCTINTFQIAHSFFKTFSYQLMLVNPQDINLDFKHISYMNVDVLDFPSFEYTKNSSLLSCIL